eukprot:357663-Chlamydomonas_euryale.AAC.9
MPLSADSPPPRASAAAQRRCCAATGSAVALAPAPAVAAAAAAAASAIATSVRHAAGPSTSALVRRLTQPIATSTTPTCSNAALPRNECIPGGTLEGAKPFLSGCCEPSRGAARSAGPPATVLFITWPTRADAPFGSPSAPTTSQARHSPIKSASDIAAGACRLRPVRIAGVMSPVAHGQVPRHTRQPHVAAAKR